MRTLIWLLLPVLCQLNGQAQNRSTKVQPGFYKKKGSSVKLELDADGTYLLLNPEGINGDVAVEQCSYSSKGKWKQISNDVLEITSENYYQKQKGFEYELKKENKFSQDSLYIKVNLPDSLLYYKFGIPVNFSFIFNDNVSKSITTNKSLISLPKQEHLSLNTKNLIGFSANAIISGTTLYKGRILFKIFEEDIDTEKINYLTITLPNFDLCFFEFEPYDHELIYVKNKKELIWQGQSWEKQPE